MEDQKKEERNHESKISLPRCSSVRRGIQHADASASFAQKYPDRPIQLVIPNAAGSLADITARMLASELEKAIGTKIIANNKPGASQVLGTDFVIRGKKDGYTLLYTGSSPLVYAPITNPEIVHYDPGKDLEPLGLHYLSCPSFNVRSDAPWKTFPEIVDYAKKNPGKLRVATSGVGHPTHFMLEVIQAVTGTQFTHVPFEGGETVTTAVLGGHVEASCDAFSKQKPLAGSRKDAGSPDHVQNACCPSDSDDHGIRI